MKILFDATELSYFLDESGHRAGVFFVALNLFRELKKRKVVELVFFCNFKRYFYLKEVIDKVEEFQGIELLKENSVVNLAFAKLNYLSKSKWINAKLKYGILSLARYYENIFYRQNKKNLKQLDEFDIYFSPFQAPSEEILNSKHLKRFRMIHDIIPILETGKVPKNKRLWCYRIYNTINQNDFYVTNYECTRKDVLNYFDIK